MEHFEEVCSSNLDHDFTDQWGNTINITPSVTIGFWCYIVCLFGAFMRVIMHWLTPLPGLGSGCTPKLPKYLMDKLDEDGDGKISWEEMKHAYKNLVAKKNKKLEDEEKKLEDEEAMAVLDQPVRT
uniref:EF-hand domain-containing protein n=1 Tax=Octactis speculum TaxID=3111310 RepID=A0A7S2HPS6_9STRA